LPVFGNVGLGIAYAGPGQKDPSQGGRNPSREVIAEHHLVGHLGASRTLLLNDLIFA